MIVWDVGDKASLAREVAGSGPVAREVGDKAQEVAGCGVMVWDSGSAAWKLGDSLSVEWEGVSRPKRWFGGQEEPPRHESLQEELLVCPSQWQEVL